MNELNLFLTTKMKMTSFYQPLILSFLISGITSNKKIAERCHLFNPQFSVNDYEKKLKIYPKKVLKSHGIAELIGNDWILLKEPNCDTLGICVNKLKEYNK